LDFPQIAATVFTRTTGTPVEATAIHGKENLLNTFGSAGDEDLRGKISRMSAESRRYTSEPNGHLLAGDDSDGGFGCGRAKRTRGVCGTPTDDDKSAGKARLTRCRAFLKCLFDEW
jgi:hypothetical protein